MSRVIRGVTGCPTRCVVRAKMMFVWRSALDLMVPTIVRRKAVGRVSPPPHQFRDKKYFAFLFFLSRCFNVIHSPRYWIKQQHTPTSMSSNPIPPNARLDLMRMDIRGE